MWQNKNFFFFITSTKGVAVVFGGIEIGTGFLDSKDIILLGCFLIRLYLNLIKLYCYRVKYKGDEVELAFNYKHKTASH